MKNYEAILSHYFASRPIARTKVLSSGQVHCAFADGTMAVYSVKYIEKMAEEILQYALNDPKLIELSNQMSEDIMIYGSGAYHVPSMERIDPMSDKMREILLQTNYLIH